MAENCKKKRKELSYPEGTTSVLPDDSLPKDSDLPAAATDSTVKCNAAHRLLAVKG